MCYQRTKTCCSIGKQRHPQTLRKVDCLRYADGGCRFPAHRPHRSTTSIACSNCGSDEMRDISTFEVSQRMQPGPAPMDVHRWSNSGGSHKRRRTRTAQRPMARTMTEYRPLNGQNPNRLLLPSDQREWDRRSRTANSLSRFSGSDARFSFTDHDTQGLVQYNHEPQYQRGAYAGLQILSAPLTGTSYPDTSQSQVSYGEGGNLLSSLNDNNSFSQNAYGGANGFLTPYTQGLQLQYNGGMGSQASALPSDTSYNNGLLSPLNDGNGNILMPLNPEFNVPYGGYTGSQAASVALSHTIYSDASQLQPSWAGNGTLSNASYEPWYGAQGAGCVDHDRMLNDLGEEQSTFSSVGLNVPGVNDAESLTFAGSAAANNANFGQYGTTAQGQQQWPYDLY